MKIEPNSYGGYPILDVMVLKTSNFKKIERKKFKIVMI